MTRLGEGQVEGEDRRTDISLPLPRSTGSALALLPGRRVQPGGINTGCKRAACLQRRLPQSDQGPSFKQRFPSVFKS